jgi:hypothetical protein
MLDLFATKMQKQDKMKTLSDQTYQFLHIGKEIERGLKSKPKSQLF